MDDFQKLGFDVQVNVTENDIKRLDDIFKRLERIDNILRGQGKGKKGLSKEYENWSKTAQLPKGTIKRQKQQGGINLFNQAKKNIANAQSLANANYDIVESERQLIATTKQARNAEIGLSSAEIQNARHREIDAKEKQKQLDRQYKIKQGYIQEKKAVEDNTNALGKYIAKLSSAVVIARKFAHFISGAIKEQASYIENLNLFAVTFGNTYKETAKWAIDLADGFGLASNEVIKFTGLFKQLSTALGITKEVGDSMAKTLTQIGYDFASFYNISTVSAMEKLQAGIFAGQVKPMRSIGIDLSYQQIDNLLKTNQALAQFNTSSKQMTQNQKAIARLILTLQAGSNAFGDMGETINSLQNQIRVFEGSMANFRLAIGDLMEEPIKFVLTLLNALITSMTRFIRSIVPLNTTSKNTAVSQLAEDTKEASDGIDELENKLASFDKFNALSSGEDKQNELLTDTLVKELEKQQERYQSQLKDIENEAQKLSDTLYECFVFAGLFISVLAVGKIAGVIKSIGQLTKGVLSLKGGFSLLNGVLVAGIIYAIIEFVKAVKEGDTETAILAGTLAGSLLVAFVALNWEMIKTTSLGIIKFFKDLFKATDVLPLAINKTAISLKQVAIAGAAMMATFAIVSMILNGLDGESKQTASLLFMLAGAIMAVVAAMVALRGVQSWGTMLPVLLAGVGMAVAGVKGYAESIKGFANGGYTNANLIMTNENGKREWIGKQAGSSAIVNDTQMSDIMEMAVAKGVYSAMKANSVTSGTQTTNQPIIIQIDGKNVFTAVQKVAKRQGVDFAKV